METELTQMSDLDELLVPTKQVSNYIDIVNGGFTAMHQFVPSGWNFDYLCFDNALQEHDDINHTSLSSLIDLISQPPPLFHQPPQPPSPPPLPISSVFNYPFLETLIDSSYSPSLSTGETNKKSNKKVKGQPSKNLMAERRRRKRLNDRLSMLRSIVPKITKMDRTSILGDAIDYMKELLDKINKLQELGSNSHINILTPNKSMVKNSPKFLVDQRQVNTDIDICCCMKPGLLLSTVNTLETLGLEIQQCVISCFNDFSVQASCSEVADQRDFVTSEDIKQALSKNAGYGGKCS